jgi:hypothetical protein
VDDLDQSHSARRCFALAIFKSDFFKIIGGERGIRTLGRFAPTPDFESGTFDHSAISPVCALHSGLARAGVVCAKQTRRKF